MKLLVIGIDAVSPDLLFENIDSYPNLKRLYLNGSGGAYSGYVYGYGSHDNWISMYTGIPPKEHGVIKGRYGEGMEYPRPEHYKEYNPLWEILNENNYSVGFWKGLSTTPPESIDGYMVSGEPKMEPLEAGDDYVDFGAQLVKKDEWILDLFKGDLSNFPYPEGPDQYNCTWEELFDEPSLIDGILDEAYFSKGLEYFTKVIDLAFQNIQRVYQQQKVEVFWFYDMVFDYLGHFQMHDANHKIMKKALLLVDDFVGKMLDLMKPENVLFISDHGHRAIKDFFPNSPLEVKKEAFGLSESCIISENHMILKGRNPGFLSALHDLKGVMIWSGENIRVQQDISMGRTLDVYPTILELLDIKIPENRKGYILPILNKQILNEKQVYREEICKKVLFIQQCDINNFNSKINEYYYENRYTGISVAVDKRFIEVMKANHQVKEILDNTLDINHSYYNEVEICN